MQQQNDSRNRRANISYRPMGELIRGLLFIVFGLYALLAERMGWSKFSLPQELIYVLGGVLCAYGLFRVYRGIKQLFF